jgi:hypothetical protein
MCTTGTRESLSQAQSASVVVGMLRKGQGREEALRKRRWFLDGPETIVESLNFEFRFFPA